jgi:hypothetical protein
MERMKYLLKKAQERLMDWEYIDGNFIEEENITPDEVKTLWNLMSVGLLITLRSLK